MAFEVSPSPSSIIVGSVNYSLIMERKSFRIFFNWGHGELSQPTGPKKQEIIRIGKIAKSTM